MSINTERRRRMLQYNTVDQILQSENHRRVKSENISSNVYYIKFIYLSGRVEIK